MQELVLVFAYVLAGADGGDVLLFNMSMSREEFE
jgi:hypothetical protein